MPIIKVSPVKEKLDNLNSGMIGRAMGINQLKSIAKVRPVSSSLVISNNRRSPVVLNENTNNSLFSQRAGTGGMALQTSGSLGYRKRKRQVTVTVAPGKENVYVSTCQTESLDNKVELKHVTVIP